MTCSSLIGKITRCGSQSRAPQLRTLPINKLVFGAFPVNFLLPFMNQTLIIVPTVNERENLPRIGAKIVVAAGRRGLAGGGRQFIGWHGTNCGRTGGATSGDPCPARDKKKRPGPGLPCRFQMGAGRSYEFIFEMDCDFSHDPDDVPKFLKAAKSKKPTWCWARVTPAACAC